MADRIRYLVDLHRAIIPTILEIPSKDAPYDASKVSARSVLGSRRNCAVQQRPSPLWGVATQDSVMQRIKFFFGGEMPS